MDCKQILVPDMVSVSEKFVRWLIHFTVWKRLEQFSTSYFGSFLYLCVQEGPELDLNLGFLNLVHVRSFSVPSMM
jgi:hypothetical protein